MNRRSFLKLLGSVGAVAALPLGWLATKPQTIRIAAFDSPPALKAAADVVCTGHNDGATWQAAIDRLADNGSIIVQGPGTFYMDRTVALPSGSVIVGCHFTGSKAHPLFSYEPGRIINTYDDPRITRIVGNVYVY